MGEKNWHKEIFSGHNKKYNIDFKYAYVFCGAYTCEFEYIGKEYGFTVRNDFKTETIKTI